MDLNNIGILEQIVLENATQPLRRTNKKYLKKLNQYNSDIAIETINLLHQSNNTILNVNESIFNCMNVFFKKKRLSGFCNIDAFVYGKNNDGYDDLF